MTTAEFNMTRYLANRTDSDVVEAGEFVQTEITRRKLLPLAEPGITVAKPA